MRSCMTPSRRSWRWTAGEKWPAMVTVPGPRFREGRGEGAVSPSGRESTSAKGLSVSGISVSHVVAQPRSEGADLASRNSVGNLRRKLALQADAGSAPARALEARIQTCDQTIQGLLLARKVTDQHILAGELSPEARLQALPQPLRLLLDTLRMLAYRAETAMTTAVAPALDNPDTARSLLKSLFQADASLHPDESAGTLTVRLLHQPTRAQDRALAPLLDELNRTRTVFPGTQLRLVYHMLSDDLPCSASSQPTPANPKPPLPASKLSKPNETV